jgi:hypothetical protein
MNDPTRMDRGASSETATLRRGRWFGGLLIITAGALLAVLCGTCTAQIIGDELSGSPRDLISHAPIQSQLELVLEAALVLAVGGLPTALGLFLIVIGWRSIRQAPQQPKADE